MVISWLGSLAVLLNRFWNSLFRIEHIEEDITRDNEKHPFFRDAFSRLFCDKPLMLFQGNSIFIAMLSNFGDNVWALMRKIREEIY